MTGFYNEDSFFQNLKTNLKKAFQVSGKLLFLCRGKWLAVQRSESFYAIFNSHSLNGKGFIETGNTARKILCKTMEKCFNLILAGTRSVDPMSAPEDLSEIEYETLASVCHNHDTPGT